MECIVHGVSKSRTILSNFHSLTQKRDSHHEVQRWARTGGYGAAQVTCLGWQERTGEGFLGQPMEQEMGPGKGGEGRAGKKW